MLRKGCIISLRFDGGYVCLTGERDDLIAHREGEGRILACEDLVYCIDNTDLHWSQKGANCLIRFSNIARS